MTLRIALAEDSYIVREGLEQLLAGDEAGFAASA